MYKVYELNKFKEFEFEVCSYNLIGKFDNDKFMLFVTEHKDKFIQGLYFILKED